MEPGREQPSAELERLRAEGRKLKGELARLVAQMGRLDKNATSTSFWSPYSPGWSPARRPPRV